MSLIELKRYLMQVKIASLAHLCAFFKADPETLKSLLDYWMRQGKVRLCQKKFCGKRCVTCPVNQSELYEWLSYPVTPSVKEGFV